MTILVLGDSFADRMGRVDPWCDILGEMLNEEVENFGLGGSALSYSYNVFRKHYEPGKYSRVIFCRTERYRQFYMDLNEPNKWLPFQVDAEQSIGMLDHLHRKINSKFQDPTELNRGHGVIFKGQTMINQMYPNTYDWVPRAITESMAYSVKEPLLVLDMEHELMKVQQLDYDALGIQFNPLLEGLNRPNHVSRTQSRELARYMHKYFTRDFDIHSVFINPEKYFTVSQNAQEAGIEI